MAFDLSSIFGGNAYDMILRDMLGVMPTGNPIKDAAYLVVLPLLTLLLFSDHVSGLLSLHKTKLKWVFMGLVVFFVIESGFYPLLAKYSLFAFIVLLIWGAWTFITSAKVEKSGGGGGGGPQRMEVYDGKKHSLNPLNILKNKATRDIKGQIGLTDEMIRQEQMKAIAEGRGDDALKFQDLLNKRKK